MFTILALSQSSNLPSAAVEVIPGDWVSYQVVNASDTVNDFFGTFPPGTYYGNWSVIPGDKIDFNVTSVQEGTINGTIFFGNEMDNETFTNVRNIDTSFGLGLGIYPWNGGFFADPADWDNVISSIEGTNTTVTYVDCYNLTIGAEQKTYSILHFNTTNYYGQFSNFYYHKTSGVLLGAFTSFGFYELEIILDDTSLYLETSSCSETSTTNLVIVSLALLILPVIYITKKRKN